MLTELRIENLLLIERAEVRPEEGLNAITGETGAGKTVLAHALDLLLGGKPRAGIVRPGAPEAYVEGVFDLPAGAAGAPRSSRTCASGSTSTTARWCWPAGSAPRAAAAPTSRAARPPRRTCARWAAGCWPSSASTSTAA